MIFLADCVCSRVSLGCCKTMLGQILDFEHNSNFFERHWLHEPLHVRHAPAGLQEYFSPLQDSEELLCRSQRALPRRRGMLLAEWR